jgi:tight adherence protein C
MSEGATASLWVAAASLLAGAVLLLWSSLRAERMTDQNERRFEELVMGRPLGQSTGRLRGTVSQLVERYGALASRIAPDREVSGLLVRAGFRGREALNTFLATQILLPVSLVAAAGLAWLAGSGPERIPFPLAVFAVFALGYLAPKQFLRRAAVRRERQLRDELPSAVHLLRVLFDGGLSTQQALKLIVGQARTPVPAVAADLGEVLRRSAAGSSFSDATREVGAQSQVAEFADLLALLRQVDRHGGAVEGPLSSFATLLEDRRRTVLQEAVGRLSAKMTVVMVVCLFPALLAFLAGPGFLAMIRTLREVHG